MDVLAIEWRHEGPVQTLDDLVGEEVAFVLDLLDFVGLVPDRLVGGEHLLEQRRAAADLLGECDEIIKEPCFSWNQPERHSILRRES